MEILRETKQSKKKKKGKENELKMKKKKDFHNKRIGGG